MEPIIKNGCNEEAKGMEELHTNANLWKSEINFINVEIRFLEHVLSSNYINCLALGLSKKTEALAKKITDKKKEGEIMLSLINEHEGFLSVLIEDDSLSSNKMFLESQKKLENDFKNYLIHYKFIKKHIFKVIENVMRKKKQKKLI